MTSVTADAREYVIYKTMDNIESIKKVAAILPKQVWATAESGKKIRVSVKGEWEINEADKCFVNSADPSGLPENITDKNHLLDEVKVPYKISDDYYDSYNTLYISPQKVKEGENIELEDHKALHKLKNAHRLFLFFAHKPDVHPNKTL